MIIRLLRLSCLLLYCSIAARAQQTLVFAGTFNRDKNKEGIQVFRLDTSSGLLQPLAVFKGILNPSYLTLSENGLFLYACTETQTPGAGSIAAFKVDPVTGSLSLLNSRSSSGENPVYLTLSKNGRYLFSVNYTEAGADIFPLEGDGSIAPVLQSLTWDEGSKATERQAKAHAHSIHLSPAQDHIFIPDLGSDLIRCYNLDLCAAKPIKEQTQVKRKAPPGSGPRHFVFHPNGKYAYCIEEISGTISAYTYNQGRLSNLQHVSAHKDTLDAYNSADIHVSPDGRFLYASNRGDENNIAIFAVEKKWQAAQHRLPACNGRASPDLCDRCKWQLLIVANQISGNLVVFRRDEQSGLLSPVQQDVKMEHVSCVQIKKI